MIAFIKNNVVDNISDSIPTNMGWYTVTHFAYLL